jgi:predicted enzyme related to lactoylglutathione lyase
VNTERDISEAMTSLFQLTLRTLDVDAARAFYAALLGRSELHIVQLHEQAVARGARPHWLGYLDVADVDRATAAFVERGATALGPKWVNPEGLEAAVMRDPGGAIVALARKAGGAHGNGVPHAPAGPEVVWYLLNTADLERAKANYGELFGWEFKPSVDLGSLGVLHPFAWERGAAPVGAMSDISGRPGVHPHWLFHFRVDALGRALDLVRDSGGLVLGPFTLPSGEGFAVCDDPQGATFAIRQER